MKSILIPTDFSKNSWNAIEYALEFFKDLKCNMYLLHVDTTTDFSGGEVTPYPSQEVINKVYLQPSKERLQKLVQKIKSSTTHIKHHFFTLTDYNYFIDSIRNQVEEKHIDFIVMGTKGASGIKKLLIGSNTADIITKVACTTLVIPENSKFKTLKEIAFPTDFSLFYSIDTLKPLTKILEMHRSSIRMLYVSNKKKKNN